jgi:hypothetical protein
MDKLVPNKMYRYRTVQPATTKEVGQGSSLKLRGARFTLGKNKINEPTKL